MNTKTYCIMKGTASGLPAPECRKIRDAAIQERRYSRGEIGLTSQRFANGKDKSGGYTSKIWIQCGIHPEDESDIPYKGKVLGRKGGPSALSENSGRVRTEKTACLDGNTLLERGAGELGLDFGVLVAKTAIWAPLEAHLACGRMAKNPNIRRRRSKEKEGLIETGVRLDSNNYPNYQMKNAIKRWYGVKLMSNTFEVCHVWPDTCHDARYHTCFANLVMLPRSLAKLSDHNTRVQKVLQYRAYELFQWYPDSLGKPTKPKNYPSEWLELQIKKATP